MAPLAVALFLTVLIEAAHEAMAAPARPSSAAPVESAPARTWRLAKSRATGWKWNVILRNKIIGRIRPPETRGGDWSGMTLASPGAEHRHYRKTRNELAALLATLAD